MTKRLTRASISTIGSVVRLQVEVEGREVLYTLGEDLAVAVVGDLVRDWRIEINPREEP